jgi:hypothetical protein
MQKASLAALAGQQVGPVPAIRRATRGSNDGPAAASASRASALMPADIPSYASEAGPCRPPDARQRGLVKLSVPCEHGG